MPFCIRVANFALFIAVLLEIASITCSISADLPICAYKVYDTTATFLVGISVWLIITRTPPKQSNRIIIANSPTSYQSTLTRPIIDTDLYDVDIIDARKK
jgi:hypothetical protein